MPVEWGRAPRFCSQYLLGSDPTTSLTQWSGFSYRTSTCQQARSSTVPPLLTRCCHPHVLVHAVPTLPYPELVPSLLISPFNWMPVSSGMTATTTNCASDTSCVSFYKVRKDRIKRRKKGGTGKSFWDRKEFPEQE